MAGRGTDIMLGGNPLFLTKKELKKHGFTDDSIKRVDTSIDAEELAENEDLAKAKETFEHLYDQFKEQAAKEQEEVKAAGGLAIIGTERHESRRIDNQLRGRSGRQGDPGTTRFYVSLEDEVMKLYGSSKSKKIAEKLDNDEEIKDKKLLKTIETSQQTLEMKNFGIRKSVLEYDNVINKQRELIYEDRRKVINGDDVSNHINEMIESEIKEIYNEYISDSIEKYIEAITTTFSLDKYNKELNLEDKKDNEIVDYTISVIKEVYKSREDLIGSEAMRDWERKVILHFVDNYWIDHIDAIEQLKKGIGLLAAGQKDPVKEFTVQSFDMFDDINKNINKDALKHLFA